MTTTNTAPRTKMMKFDVSTRKAANIWLRRRIKKLGQLMILAAVLSPVASAIVVIIKHYRRAKEFPPIGPLVSVSLMWAVIAIVLMAIIAALIGARYFKFLKRASPILDTGHEQ